MKNKLVAAAAALAIVLVGAVAVTANAGGGITAAKRPVLAFNGYVPWDGDCGSFTVPQLPEGADIEEYYGHVRLVFESDVIVGGQNRANVPHPGIDSITTFNGCGIMLRFRDAAYPEDPQYPWINSVLTSLSTSRAVLDWTPTLPAQPGELADAELWEIEYELGNPSIYWGGGNPAPPGPYQQDFEASAEWLAVEPGMEVWMDVDMDWSMPDWPLGHEWPLAAMLEMDTVLYFEWVKRPL